MTRRQSNNQWNGGIAAHPTPRISESKNPLEKFSPRFFFWGGGSRLHPPHWLSSKGPDYQRGVLLISGGAIEGHFEGKSPRKVHQGCLVLAGKYPGSPGTCNLEVTILPGLTMSWQPTLFSGSDPVGLPPFLWTEKKIGSSPFFVWRRSISAAETWLDGQLSENFLSGLQTLEQGAKKCIALRGEYVEKFPSLFAVVCFLPGRVKDLSAPRTLLSTFQ